MMVKTQLKCSKTSASQQWSRVNIFMGVVLTNYWTAWLSKAVVKPLECNTIKGRIGYCL